jgi:hypothetical protein
MGGKDEFTTPATTDGGSKIGNLRIHENAGEVHFHDDQNKLKVAVPVAAMYDIWEKLRDGRKKRFKHRDLTNRAVLQMKVIRKKNKPIDLQMVVTPMKDSATTEFTSFDQFIRGRDVG